MAKINFSFSCGSDEHGREGKTQTSRIPSLANLMSSERGVGGGGVDFYLSFAFDERGS